MGSLVVGFFKGVWWIIAAFFSSLGAAIAAPYTIMNLDDSARSLKKWYED